MTEKSKARLWHFRGGVNVPAPNEQVNQARTGARRAPAATPERNSGTFAQVHTSRGGEAALRLSGDGERRRGERERDAMTFSIVAELYPPNGYFEWT
jgi:hypothetical protein